MRTHVIAHGPSWRAVRAALLAVGRTSPLVLGAILVVPDLAPAAAAYLDNPLRLARVFALVCAAPVLAAWLLGRVFRGSLAIADGTLRLERLGVRAEIPCASIARLGPWMPPLPGAGVTLTLASGRRFSWGVQLPDPIALGAALGDAGAPETVRCSVQTPAAVYGRSLGSARSWTDHPAFKFVAFALVPALPLFRLHQWIAFGGTFGEYYVYGLGAYLLGFAVFWASSIVHLVLWAAGLRAFLEPVVALAAWRAPARTPSVRRVGEAVLRGLYYGGVALLLLRIYLQSS